MSFFSSLAGPVLPTDVFVFGEGTVDYFRFDRPSKERRLRLVAARESELEPSLWHDQPFGRSPTDSRSVSDAVSGARRLAGGALLRASVVVPDSWIRIFLIDFESMPRSASEVDEMVSWKLKKLLTIRPEEFRFVWQEIGAAGNVRKLFVVGILEKVAAGLENAFSANGVRIGSITPMSSTLANLPIAGDDDFTLVATESSGFQILVVKKGEPVLYRSKRFLAEEIGLRGEIAHREIELTRAFLEASGGLPGRCRLWQEEDDSSLDLRSELASAFPLGVDPVRGPGFLEIAPEFPAPLARRSVIAAGTFLERGYS